MTPDRWARVEELFAAALLQPLERRAAYLEKAPTDDPGLCREVQELLESHSRAGSFLEQPASLTGEAVNRSAEQPSDLIGETLSSYTVLAPLGRGGMGQVYLAEDKRLGRKVAIKLLAAELTADPIRVRRFEQEARTASGLNHPNIVTIHDIGQAPAGHFIVMEWIEGHTLKRMIGEPISTPMLMSLGGQVARALAIAHAAGLAHRDIKPENIMVRDDGYVKVLDFGLVRLLQAADEPTSAGQTLQDRGFDSISGQGMLLGTLAVFGVAPW